MNSVGNEIILPVTFPSVSSYPAETYILSILLNYKQTDNWIYNNFINLYGYITKENYIYQAFAFDAIRRACPYIYLNRFMDRDFIDDNFGGIIQFIKTCIASGYYIILQYNQYFLHHASYYKKTHRMHELFVYGFNDITKIFYISDFFNHGKLSSREVSFLELDESVSHVPREIFEIDILKFKPVNYEFKFDLLIKELNDYLNSTRTILCYEENCLTPAEIHRLSEGNYVFGISNYDLINNALLLIIAPGHDGESLKPEFFGIYSRIRRSAHVLYNHKVLMVERLKFLQNKGIGVDADSILKYERIKELCFINRNLILKYEITLDAGIIRKVIRNYEIARVEEECILKNLVVRLRM